MNQSENNGAPRQPSKPIILPDGSELFRVSEDDPDTTFTTWPNCGPSDLAFPPKKDEIRETRGEELNALVNAMTAYKSKRGLQYLLWHNVLDVLHDMGYRKVAAPAPTEPTPANSSDEIR